VQVKSPNQMYIFGKGGGTTTVYASNAKGDIIWSANVRVGSNFDSVDSMLRLAMPDAQINVATMGENTFLLTGTVKSPEDAAEAERLVQAYVGEKANVISRLRTATPLQVNLQVRIAEVSRSLVREIGANLTSIDGSSGFQFGIGRGRAGFAPRHYAGPGQTLGMGQSVTTTIPDPLNPGQFITVQGSSVNPINGGTTIAGAGRLLGLDLLGALDLGERAGLVTTLSQPNLTALSGETAEFLAGGEFPIPLSQGLGTTTVEYKKFGVSLAYTPVVLSNGRISIRVRPEVSELSSQGAITLNGFQVPALTVRRAETTVELGSGQSFMIAGLMSNGSQNSIDKTPGVGDLPILGSLFRSSNFRKGETELVIVVTPYLVNPVNANDIALPTDGYLAPNELQRLFGNMNSDGKSGQQRPEARAADPEQTATPSVSLPDPVDGADKGRKRKKSGKADRQTASAPAPGFSLK
ncbi:MAG: type II and III secretion system protein family protein, partial [Novosphingobium sp.]|nr:type II and III secretion system protein family protein [Novosphingobium sp.]